MSSLITVAPPKDESIAAANRTGPVALALLSFAHFNIDLYSSALGAMQPLLVERLSLSLGQAGLLGGALVFSASLLQPLYGYLADRVQSRLFTVLAPAVAGLFISSLCLAASYASLFAFVLLGGAGIASFHPQASSRVTHGVSAARGRWMAIFISSGTLGLALGPTFFTWIPQWLGFERTYWSAVPGVLCTVLLWFALPAAPGAGTSREFDLAPLRAAWKPLTLLYFCVFIRSIVQVTYTHFLPLYLHRERALPLGEASFTLSLYLAFGAIGGVVGGNLADRIGGRRVIMLSMIGSVPFLLAFFWFTGVASTLALLAGGVVLLFTIPVNVVMAQELAPAQGGTVSALMMGFAWGLAGMLSIPLTGLAADYFTMHRVLAVLALFPILGFFLARALPQQPRASAHA